MPAFNCEVVPQAVVGAGGIPHWIDVSLTDGNLDPESLELQARSTEAKLIVVTHMFGNTCRRSDVIDVQKKHKIQYVLVDAALALESFDDGQHVASLHDGAILSFSTGKHLSWLEGGAFVSNNYDVFKKVEAWTQNNRQPATMMSNLQKLGFLIGTSATYGLHLYPVADWLYNSTPLLNFLSPGIRGMGLPEDLMMKPTRLQIALASQQITYADSFATHRRQIQDAYQKNLSGVAITNSHSNQNALSHFSICTPMREKLFEAAHRARIFLRGGLYEYNLAERAEYAAFPGDKSPNASRLAREVVNLPLHSSITIQKAEQLSALVKESLGDDLHRVAIQKDLSPQLQTESAPKASIEGPTA